MPVRLIPPGGPPTIASLAEDEAWSSVVSNQLADVRKTAENWRNGLVALMGVIATFSVIKGSSELKGLVGWAAYLVGVLLALSLLSAVLGAWRSLAAAYGTPSAVTREDFHALGGINGFRLKLAKKAADNLRVAQAATIVTLALVAAAVALTWYGPRSPSVIVKVERKSAADVCGKLVSSKDGDMDIKPVGSDPARVHLTDVISVHAVEECP